MTGMWGISDSATYSSASYIYVTGSAPAALPARVVFDSYNHAFILR